MSVCLFVYGSLRVGFSHPMSAWLHGQGSFVGHGMLPGKLYLVNWYPGYVPGPRGEVHGDIVALRSEAVLEELDHYEECFGNPEDEYRREQMSVRLDNGSERLAWVYVFQRSIAGLAEITSGNFLVR